MVGYARKGALFHAFLYDGAGMWDLNDLVEPSTWTLVDARGINDSGQIAAVASGYVDGQFTQRAVLLNPQ